MSAPERIWLNNVNEAPGFTKPPIEWVNPAMAVEYRRADIAEAKAADLQAKLTECCLQALATDGQAADALDRAIRAEAEAANLRAKLAEARADALREAAEVAMERHRKRMVSLGRDPDDYHSDGVMIHDAILRRIAKESAP